MSIITASAFAMMIYLLEILRVMPEVGVRQPDTRSVCLNIITKGHLPQVSIIVMIHPKSITFILTHYLALYPYSTVYHLQTKLEVDQTYGVIPTNAAAFPDPSLWSQKVRAGRPGRPMFLKPNPVRTTHWTSTTTMAAPTGVSSTIEPISVWTVNASLAQLSAKQTH